MRTLVRMLAVLLLVGALLPRGVAEHERLLVVALDGARLGYIEALAADGSMPVLARLLGQGVVATVYGGQRSDRDGYWHTAFAGASPSEPLLHEAAYLWDVAARAGAPPVAVAVPGTGRDGAGGRVFPGANEADGFVGDSTGIVVEVSHLEKGQVDWPYRAASGRIAEWMHELSAGQRSPWIAVAQPSPDTRVGVFKVYRLDEEQAYLTPIYARSLGLSEHLDGVDADLRYVAEAPTWAVSSPRLRDYFYLHAGELAADRGALAARLATEDWKLMVHFETILLPAYHVYGAAAAGEGQAAIPEALVEAYADVDARIGALVDAAGPEAVVAVIGREPRTASSELASREQRAPSQPEAGTDPRGSQGEDLPRTPLPSGFLLVSGAAGDRLATTTGVDRIVPTLLYLLGLPEQGPTGAGPIHAVRARYWRRSSGLRVLARQEEPVDELPFNVESFERLGLLSETARAPDAEAVAADSDAEVNHHH